MKALSLTEPWALFVALREKRIETRPWRTTYRGPLAIHAAKGFPMDARLLLFRDEHFRSTFVKAGYRLGSLSNPSWIPLGAVLAVGELVTCKPTETVRLLDLPAQELIFGDYSPGRWMWLIENVRRFREPILAKGALSLWEWTPPPNWETLLEVEHA